MTTARRMFAAAWLSATAFVAMATAAPAADRRPNIVLMISYDQGWDGTSVEMAPGVAGSKGAIFHTPNLERLAAQGMRFSDAYAPAPVCSPTRISIQTGRSPAALHWTKAAPPEEGHRLVEPRLVKQIAADETTIGELLGQAGYATAHYGKWHISGGGPAAHGYDESDGDTGNEHAGRFTDPNPVDIFGMAERAEAFMKKSRGAGKPFFVQLSWNALHMPENALEATKAKYSRLAGGGGDRRSAVAALTEDLDTGVGRVLDAIDRLGLAGDTCVIYMSDNGAGGGGKRGGLSGGKGSVWEGGIRVPFIVRGPGVAPGSWCHVPVVGEDLLPTFCEWAGVPAAKVPRAVEGGSIAGLLAHAGKGEVTRRREELVFHFPHYQTSHAPHSAIRVGDLKLIKFYEDDSVKLFDLGKDIGEREDLAAKMPAEAARLKQRLERHLADVGAQLPTPNPAFDPSAPAEERPRKGGRGGMKKEGKGRGGKQDAGDA
ncbi:MAG: sulfatase [Planctomycetaceae bacterium]